MSKKPLWGLAIPGFATVMAALLVSTLFASPADPVSHDVTFETPPDPESSLPVLIGSYKSDGAPDEAQAGSPAIDTGYDSWDRPTT